MERLVSNVKEFWELAFVCLKMLFRESVKWRFILLIIGFIFVIICNFYNHFDKYKKVEIEKKNILQEDAFKIFFIYSLEPEDYENLVDELQRKLPKFNSILIRDALIFQKNLFVDIESHEKASEPLQVMYNLFDMENFVNGFEVKDKKNFFVSIKNEYIDYNGSNLEKKKQEKRFRNVADYIENFSDNLSGKMHSQRKIRAFREKRNLILKHIERVPHNKEINPYLSKVELIIPKNILNIMFNLSRLSTNRIISGIQYDPSDSKIKIRQKFIEVPEGLKDEESYGYRSWFPRFSPIYMKGSIGTVKHLLYELMKVDNAFMEYLKDLHSREHYLFSYEKLDIMQFKVDKINSNIKSAQRYFLFIDLIIGIIFPFMVSFFSFIYLKKEIAFLLFHKNKLKLILWVFYTLPLMIMLVLKSGLYMIFFKLTFVAYLVIPLLLSFIFASMIFWFINIWCFKEFFSNQLNLYEIFKGK